MDGPLLVFGVVLMLLLLISMAVSSGRAPTPGPSLLVMPAVAPTEDGGNGGGWLVGVLLLSLIAVVLING